MPFSTETPLILSKGRMSIVPQSGTTQGLPLMTAPTPSDGGCLHFSEAEITFTRPHEIMPLMQGGNQPNLRQIYISQKELGFTIKTPIYPPNGVGGTTVPEVHHLLAAVFGTATINAGVDISYTHNASAIPNLLSIAMTYNRDNQIQGYFLWNCYLETMKLTLTGGAVPMLEFTGRASDGGWASQAPAAATIDSNSFGLDVANRGAIGVGAFVSLNGAAQASGLGWQVGAVNSDGIACDVVGGSDDVAAALSIGETIAPFLGAPASLPVHMIGPMGHSMTFDGINLQMKSAEFTWDLGTIAFEDEVGADGINGGHVGNKVMTANIVTRAGDTTIRNQMQRLLLNSSNVPRTAAGTLVLATGAPVTGAGRTFTFTFPALMPDAQAANASGESTGDLVLAVKAYDTADGSNDASSLVIT